LAALLSASAAADLLPASLYSCAAFLHVDQQTVLKWSCLLAARQLQKPDVVPANARAETQGEIMQYEATWTALLLVSCSLFPLHSLPPAPKASLLAMASSAVPARLQLARMRISPCHST